MRTAGWLPAGPVSVGLTAGASTPNDVVGEVVTWLLAPRIRTPGELEAVQRPGYLTARQHVACQELGHGLGLDHDYAPDTCMDDSNPPFHTQPQPGAHDIEQLAALYSGPPPQPTPPPPGCHNLQCYPSLRQCQAECSGVCERRILCGSETAHKCFEEC